MEITYIYGNVLRLRLPTAVVPLHSESFELARKLHKWKSSHKRKSCLIRLTEDTNLFISSNHSFTLFSRIKLFFSFLQTTKMNLKGLTTLQQPWTNWLAPTMWTWLMPRQIWTNFLVQKFFRLLGHETQSVQEGRKQTISTGMKLDNGRGRF